MRRIARAMRTWNPAMWASSSGLSALLGAGSDTIWIYVPAYAALMFLYVMAIVITLDEATR